MYIGPFQALACGQKMFKEQIHVITQQKPLQEVTQYNTHIIMKPFFLIMHHKVWQILSLSAVFSPEHSE